MTAFPHLQNQQYMSLTTFRKNGDPVSTPVWFAQIGDKLYVYSAANTGKIKRLQHTQRVTVAPCTGAGKVTGEVQEAVARILSAAEGKIAEDAINHKYGWQKRGLAILSAIMRLFSRRERAGATYLEITSA
jgi:uncharacterized protein